MKPLMILGIVLIILGAVGLVVQGVTYTTREKVVDVAGIQISAETQKTIPVPLIAGTGGHIPLDAVAVNEGRRSLAE